MPMRRFAALVLVATATLAACGSSNDADSGSASAAIGNAEVAVGAAPLPAASGGIAEAVAVAAGAPGEAADAACTLDRQALEAAAETYELLNSAVPTSQQDLLDAQMIREPSIRFDISADGAVVPAPGSPCT
jgi:hypothetical protein